MSQARIAACLIALMALSGAGFQAMAQAPVRQAAPPGAQVYFHYPVDGLSVPERFTVRIGLRGMGVAPAGINHARTGHHHLLIDTDPGQPDQPIPSDYNNIHLGNGQTEVVVTLPKGRHTLQLLVGDPQNPLISPYFKLVYDNVFARIYEVL